MTSPSLGSARRLFRNASPWVALALAAMFALPAASAVNAHGAAFAGAPPSAALPRTLPTHALVLPKSPTHSSGPTLAPHPSSGPVASGRGTFFTTASIPNPPPGSVPCLANYFATTTCANTTNDPSLNYTSDGTLAVAYTAYTNASQCANVSGSTLAQVGFSTSSNNGTTWSTPIYLGNPDCSVASDFPDAWTPSLTSLANGTLVLAYIEFNVTAYTQIPASLEYGDGWGPYGYRVPTDRLVVTESYDDGSTWTNPTVLNSSSNPGLNASAFAPERPWVTATGQTVYVAWMNYSAGPEFGGSVASGWVHLKVSTDGGATWGATKDLRSVASSSGSFSFNPTLAIGAAGALLVTYGTNVTFDAFNYSFDADVEVASSTNNGTSFTYGVAAHTVPVDYYNYPHTPFIDPSPQIAYAPSTGQVLVTYSAAVPTEVCYSYGCYLNFEPEVFVANSSDGGATWSADHIAAPELNGNGQGFSLYNPSIAVGPTGTVYLEMSYVNGSLCGPTIYGSYCGEQSQVFAWSNDNGATFSSAVEISGNMSVLPVYPDGEYDTLLTVGTGVYVGWTINLCIGALVAYCDWPGYPGNGITEVQVSGLFEGTGFDLNFTETGLVASTVWDVSVVGNLRSAAAPTPLQVTGVPDGYNASWVIGNPPAGYGIRYFGAPSLASPAVITANTTVTETFTEQVLVNITSTPYIPGADQFTSTYCGNPIVWDSPHCPEINYNITPDPGPDWVAVGASVVLNVTNQSQWCPPGFCYFTELNLSFESWTGNGAGSINTSANYTSVVANSPINETANFDVTGWCYVEKDPPFFSYDSCWKQNSSIAFHESGLPAGQNWTVSVQGSGVVSTVSSNSSWIYVSGAATSKIGFYYIWTIPAGGGEYWVGTGTPSSPVELPIDGIVDVQFVKEMPSASVFPLFVNQTGLPPGSNWSLTIAGNGFGVLGNATSFALRGGSYALNASPMFLTNGTAYYANQVSTTPLVENGTVTNYTTPASVAIDGPTLAQFAFTPAYYTTVTAGTGGSVNASSQWVQASRSLHLNATPNAGYAFIGWTGDGLGAVNSSHSAITVTPSGPVTEFAAFVRLPPSTWTVTVKEVGLPTTLPFTVGLGTEAYTGNGTFHVSGLASGNYTVRVGFVYLNSSNLTRFLPTLTESSYASNAGGALEIASDGFVNVTFAPQYLLTLSSTGNGTIAPAAGTFWETPSSVVTVSAMPDPHYRFVGWNGSGVGSIDSAARSITLTLGGPVWETGQFLWAPTPAPKTYNLTVTEQGLPGRAAWAATVGTIGAQGSGSGLTIAGLNGSYTLVVPPVYVGTGTRYVANATSVTASLAVSVAANQSLSVSFTEQFLVTVTNGSGGTVSAIPTSGGWVNAGASVTLSATPVNASYVFSNWSGTGDGSYTGTVASTTLTVNGPITEGASFAPVYPVKSTGSATAGEPLAFGLLAVLLVVGLLIGYLVFRRRPAPPSSASSADDDRTTDGDGDPGEEPGAP
jgi:List-Bact-rpt repeat protein